MIGNAEFSAELHSAGPAIRYRLIDNRRVNHENSAAFLPEADQNLVRPDRGKSNTTSALTDKQKAKQKYHVLVTGRQEASDTASAATIIGAFLAWSREPKRNGSCFARTGCTGHASKVPFGLARPCGIGAAVMPPSFIGKRSGRHTSLLGALPDPN